MDNVTLDIDGNMWCLKSDGCIAEPNTTVGFGATIAEVKKDYFRYEDRVRLSLLANMPDDAVPIKIMDFVAYQPKGSPNIKTIGFNHQSNSLLIEFHNEQKYRYFDVPQELWQQLLVSEKPGAFLADKIKGKYRYYHINGD